MIGRTESVLPIQLAAYSSASLSPVQLWRGLQNGVSDIQLSDNSYGVMTGVITVATVMAVHVTVIDIPSSLGPLAFNLGVSNTFSSCTFMKSIKKGKMLCPRDRALDVPLKDQSCQAGARSFGTLDYKRGVL